MIVAVVPIKRLSEAKGRLSAHLSPLERQRLVLRLAARAVEALRDSGVAARIAVTTPEPQVAARLGAEYLPDTGGLNASVRSAMRWAESAGAKGLLVLPGDLPGVTGEDIAVMVEDRSGLTIAPTHDGGTGALFLAPPACIPPQFGVASYARHLLSACERGVPVREIDRDGLRFDLDTIEDIDRLGGLLQAG